jgi:L-cystine uptake protein TcyP (sodium:dicarboxylate symporter family)
MYHTFDAQFGSAVIILRLLMGIFFIISIIFTYNESRYRVQEFIKKFGIIGAGYINLIPIIIWFADKIVASKDRNEFVFISI